MQTERFTFLFQQYLNKHYTQEEKSEFFRLLNQREYHQLLEQLSEQYAVPTDQAPQVDEGAATQILQSILQFQEEGNVIYTDYTQPDPRVHFLRRWGWAASVIILLGAGTYLWTTSKKTEQPLANGNKHLQTHIHPGGEKAILTLADGSSIVLDSGSNGQLANQYGSKVLNKDGQVIYESADISARNVVYNTMSTPRGGQYRLTLADGTKVWLNAATSITYPIVFVGKERNVKVSGEAYFEVTKDKQKPFVVDIDGKSTVQVLGTEFNINSYGDEDEGSIKTTLIEGSVKVIKADQDVMLKPGQQAMIAVAASSDRQQDIKVSSDADLDKILAWKNGLFNFDEADLYTVMRQLERWYDINVQYDRRSSTSMIFQGKMYRNANLSDVLEMLKKMGANFRMEGKTLIVL